jgi:hypothetical protein
MSGFVLGKRRSESKTDYSTLKMVGQWFPKPEEVFGSQRRGVPYL